MVPAAPRRDRGRRSCSAWVRRPRTTWTALAPRRRRGARPRRLRPASPLELGEIDDAAGLRWQRLRPAIAEHGILRVKGFADVAGQGHAPGGAGVGGPRSALLRPRLAARRACGRADLDRRLVVIGFVARYRQLDEPVGMIDRRKPQSGGSPFDAERAAQEPEMHLLAGTARRHRRRLGSRRPGPVAGRDRACCRPPIPSWPAWPQAHGRARRRRAQPAPRQPHAARRTTSRSTLLPSR